MFTLTLHERPGVCRWCGCTDSHACAASFGDGCHWMNRSHTLCSECADFDRQIRTTAGRAALVDTYRIGEDEVSLEAATQRRPARARTRRRR